MLQKLQIYLDIDDTFVFDRYYKSAELKSFI